MKYDLRLSKRAARHIINIVDLAEQSSDGYWCHEVMLYNSSVALSDRDLVNGIAQQVLDGKIPKSAVEKYL